MPLATIFIAHATGVTLAPWQYLVIVARQEGMLDDRVLRGEVPAEEPTPVAAASSAATGH